MLNLLFISDSPKIETIKKTLQPLLKVIIHVVPDFDHGLQDVFEKRPATVFIQDQIAGVTGESVARHIQMLLGNGAPKFILIHRGNSNAEQIKDLFEYAVDLNQPEDKLAEEFLSKLKVLIGDQWDKILIPSENSPASIESLADSSVETSNDTDKLADNLLPAIDINGLHADDDQVSAPSLKSEVGHREPSITLTKSDELAEMHNEHAFRSLHDFTAATSRSSITEGIGQLSSEENVKPQATTNLNAEDITLPSVLPEIVPKPAHSGDDESEPQKLASPALDNGMAVRSVTDGVRSASAHVSQAPPVAPAAFSINRKSEVRSEKQIPENIPFVFEENDNLKPNATKRLLRYVIVLLVLVLLVVWYVVENKPAVPVSMNQRAVSIISSNLSPAINPPAPASPTVASDQKSPQAVIEKQSVSPAIPAFIPRDGYDKSFGVNNPGWERYPGEQIEYRLFRSDAKTRAVQVLANKDNVIPDSLVRTVLTELVGGADYQIISREKKSGYLILRGTAAQKADVIFYNKDSAVKAFVVSLF